MSRSKPDDPATAITPSESSFEDAMAEVEAIVEQIESGEIGLEASLAKYERGAVLVKRCRDLLAQAEQRIETLDRQMSADSETGAAERAKPAPKAGSDADKAAD
jgi:exodeoxyribonuclease VII small subunit